jgi:hypothetical protein
MPAIFALYNLTVVVISFLSDENSSDFGGIGKEILGGFVLAVVVAVAYTFIRLRLRDKKPPAQFISINPEKSEPSSNQ